MTKMTLTQKSEEQLYRQDNATGVVFIKTGNKEVTSFEFYRARDGKIYLAGAGDAIEVMEVLTEIVGRIAEEVI